MPDLRYFLFFNQYDTSHLGKINPLPSFFINNSKRLFKSAPILIMQVYHLLANQTTLLTLNNFGNWILYPIALFLISFCLILWNWQNFLITLLGIEMMYFSITTCFIFTGWAINDPKGHIYALLLVVLAAAESAVGLGILIVLYRFGKSIEFSSYNKLVG